MRSVEHTITFQLGKLSMLRIGIIFFYIRFSL